MLFFCRCLAFCCLFWKVRINMKYMLIPFLHSCFVGGQKQVLVLKCKFCADNRSCIGSEPLQLGTKLLVWPSISSHSKPSTSSRTTLLNSFVVGRCFFFCRCLAFCCLFWKVKLNIRGTIIILFLHSYFLETCLMKNRFSDCLMKF